MSDARPEVSLDDEAAAHARREGGAITIRTSPRHGCCGGTVDMAVVDTAPPANPADFLEVERQGVTVFVARELAGPGATPVRVGLDRLLTWRSLYVEGAPSRR